MTMEVLQDRPQISKARQELMNKGVSFVESSLRSLMRRLKLVRGVALGYRLKSWDVLSTINFLETYVHKGEPILDIGCYASEIIIALHKLGYSNLTGIDLNARLMEMPHKGSIRYVIGDFMHTGFEDASFQAITSISVIEHGFDCRPLLKEMSRLLKTGGYFIASFDYWPEKIDTKDVSFFGMEWKIFSKDEVADMIAEAANYGLFPLGETSSGVKNKPIDYGGKQYTFAWLALKKSV